VANNRLEKGGSERSGENGNYTNFLQAKKGETGGQEGGYLARYDNLATRKKRKGGKGRGTKKKRNWLRSVVTEFSEQDGS